MEAAKINKFFKRTFDQSEEDGQHDLGVMKRKLPCSYRHPDENMGGDKHEVEEVSAGVLEGVVEDLKRKLAEKELDNDQLASEVSEKMEGHKSEVSELTKKFEYRERENELIIEFLTSQVNEEGTLKRMLEERVLECEEETRSLQRQLDEREEKLEAADMKIVQQKNQLDKHKHLAIELSSKIECPVCLDIPRTGPVPVCPNGHFVCIKCKAGTCPTCRAAMGSGKSLLAVTVLENIDHKCMFDDCQDFFSLSVIKDHEAGCPHRLVQCPAPDTLCTMRVPLSSLSQHLKASTCSFDYEKPIEILHDWNCLNFSTSNLDLAYPIVWRLYVYESSGKMLVIFPKKFDGQFYFVPVLAASKTECLEYKIEMVVHEHNSEPQESELSVRFQGSPLSVDDPKISQKMYGTTDQLINGIMEKSGSKNAFNLSFKLSRKC